MSVQNRAEKETIATALEELRDLDGKLRAAMGAALRARQSGLAVALDTARDFVEMVLAEAEPTASRIALARARVDIALAVWRRLGAATGDTDTAAGTDPYERI
jgi:hypothetical protein